MRFEEFEPRIVFDQSLGPAAEVGIDTTVDVVPDQPPQPPRPQLPGDIQYRETDDDFVYSSDEMDPDVIDQLAATTSTWSSSPAPIRKLSFSDSEVWLKTINTYPPRIHSDGYIVAERFESYPNAHTLLVANKLNSDDFALGGAYSKQDYHYRISFDVRHPKSELSWLTDHKWALVMQMWGPREAGESARNPPLSIYTVSNNGVPSWIVRNLGDSRRTTQTGQFEEENRTQPIPMENIGDWNHWDLEYVPNPFGKGVLRAWLNGKLVADWVDIKSNYYSVYNGVEVGPFNPAFGLYSQMAENGMEAHFDNIVLESNGSFESSIAGHVTGTADLEDNTVFATNAATGKRYGTLTGSAGVYTLAVPKGVYSLTAVNQDTGHQVTVGNVDTRQRTKVVDVDVSDVLPPAPVPHPTPSLLTLTGDVNGDGNSDVINRLADGSWQVTEVRDAQPNVSPVSRGGRDSGASEPPPPSLSDLGLSAETSVWSTWSTATDWSDIQLADFTGDGLQDIAGRDSDGNWWVAVSTGDSFQNQHWGQWTPGVDWLDVSVGDFNGDGLADIAGRAATNASWWIAISSGAGFSNSPFGRWTEGVQWQHVSVGDFNGDGLSDIAGRAQSDGTWWISQSNGQTFRNSYWGKFTTDVQWQDVMVGDFNGDGRSDIIGRAGSDQTWWAGISAGDRFQNTYFGRWTDVTNWVDVSVADVNGDGLSDVMGRAEFDGSWWVSQSSGSKFQNYFWGAIWATETDWIAAAIDDFDGDGAADLLGGSADDQWLMSV